MNRIKSLLISVSLILSSASYASNEGPRGVPNPPPPGRTVLAEVDYVPGFSPRPVRRRVQVLADGSIVERRWDQASSEETSRTLAKLSPEAVERFAERVDSFEMGPLVDLDSGAPACADVPRIAFSVFDGEGDAIPFLSLAYCHTYQIQNGPVVQARAQLEALLELTSLWDTTSVQPAREGTIRVLLEKITGSHFAPLPQGSKIDVLSNGEVRSIGGDIAGPNPDAVARLSPEFLAQIESSVRAITPSQLVDSQSGQPTCNVWPTSDYFAYPSRSRRIAVGKYYQCHRFVPVNGQGADLRGVLNAFGLF